MRDKLQSDKCARSLKALADRDRLRIIQCLQEGEQSVGGLAKSLRLEIANVSHHLGVLRHAGLVRDRKAGKYVLYSLAPKMARPDAAGKRASVLDLGCCRLDIGRQ